MLSLLAALALAQACTVVMGDIGGTPRPFVSCSSSVVSGTGSCPAGQYATALTMTGPTC